MEFKHNKVLQETRLSVVCEKMWERERKYAWRKIALHQSSSNNASSILAQLKETYEVIIEEGKLMYKQSRELIDISEGLKVTNGSLFLSTSKSLYVGKVLFLLCRRKRKFQHSSFLDGGVASAAGRLVAENGLLKAVWPHSGHYPPTEDNFQESGLVKGEMASICDLFTGLQ